MAAKKFTRPGGMPISPLLPTTERKRLLRACAKLFAGRSPAPEAAPAQALADPGSESTGAAGLEVRDGH